MLLGNKPHAIVPDLREPLAWAKNERHQSRRCATSLPRSFGGTLYSSIARAMAVSSSGAVTVPTYFCLAAMW
jgi:hypothetical protein